MVRALIELNEETNRVLNMVKAKHGFKDKAKVIEYIVRKFQDKEEMPELKFLKDGDKWVLAEEIPDMDFFFSQMWGSCFVNQFVHPSGKPYKKFLGVYKGYHLHFYFGDKDSNEVADNLVQKMLKNPEFAIEINKKIVYWSDVLRELCEKIPEKNLDQLSNEQIWEIYNNHDLTHTEYYQWGWIPVAADMFHNNLTEVLKKHLHEKGLSEEKANEYFIKLTQPTRKSLVQVEQEDFLKIAIEIKKDKYHRELFEKLYKHFREMHVAKFGYQTHTKEYEDELEKVSGRLIAEIKPGLMKKIKKHYDNNFYVNHMWVGKALSLEFYIKELVKLIGNHSDVEATVKEMEKEFEEAVAKKEKVVAELNLEKKWQTLFDAFGEFMVTKIYRRFAQIYAVYKMEFIQKEVAKRFGISLMEVRFMVPEEVKAALLRGTIDKEELKERSRFCVYYAEKGKDVIFTGVKAKELAKEASEVEIGNVKEIKGQTACMGKAKGKVRIIIRPSDMPKMKKGDILVSIATDPDIVTAMKKAAAIVTEQGGVTSHAAIVSRELGIPCVIGTKIATKVLKDGDLVEVNADKGIVKILKRI